MKKVILVSLVSCLSFAVHAQYKKAGGYFGKSGRTYGFGTSMHFLGDGKGSPVGAYVSIGREREEKRWFSWTNFTFIPPIKFSYHTLAAVTNDNYTDPVTITGKTNLGITYDVNWGVFLHNVNNTESKFKPYVTFGFNAQVLGSVNENSTNRYDFAVSYYSFQREPSFSTIGVGAKIGVGFIYMFNEKVGLKADGGYNHFYNISYNEPGPGLNPDNFFSYVSGPYAGLGLQFRLMGKE
jgi:hypothetical protein